MSKEENSNKENSNKEKYNVIMPESDDRVLCVLINKPISPEGYGENFLPRVQAMLAAHNEIRLLVVFEEYQGWDIGAAALDMSTLAEIGKKIVKVAHVNPPQNEIWRTTALSSTIAGELRRFAKDEFAAALEWVRS